MELGTIFYENQYDEACNYSAANGYTIGEISPDENGVRRFQIQTIPKPSDEQLKELRIVEIQNRLLELDQDIVQDIAGEVVPEIDLRKAEFIALHNELRILLGKEPRAVKGEINALQ